MVNLLPCPGALSTTTSSAMGLDHMAHQRQAQAAALCVVHQRITGPIEFLEDLLLLRRWDANPLVHHFQLHDAIDRDTGSRPDTSGRCEYLTALFTRFSRERAMASRSTCTGGKSFVDLLFEAKPCRSIW